MLNLRESDIKFIKDNVSENTILLTTDSLREFLCEFYDWIMFNGFDETGESYNDLGREAQKIYDYVYANCKE